MCSSYYSERGRKSIPPGICFRTLLVGCFKSIDLQRGVAWHCGDNLSLRSFLGLSLTDKIPDHSSLTRIRQRFPLELYHQVFLPALDTVDAAGLFNDKTVGIDSTTLEANVAMRSSSGRTRAKTG